MQEWRDLSDERGRWRQLRLKGYKAMLFVLFLFFPSVSRTVAFAAAVITRTDSLSLTDSGLLLLPRCERCELPAGRVSVKCCPAPRACLSFSLRCYDGEWNTFLGPAIAGVLLYPVRLPAVFPCLCISAMSPGRDSRAVLLRVVAQPHAAASAVDDHHCWLPV